VSAGCCLQHALAIAKTPPETWAAQLACLPQNCPSPQRCDPPHDCRERNAVYLRVQYRMARRRACTGTTQWTLPMPMPEPPP
jgi:hypothetical protein